MVFLSSRNSFRLASQTATCATGWVVQVEGLETYNFHAQVLKHLSAFSIFNKFNTLECNLEKFSQHEGNQKKKHWNTFTAFQEKSSNQRLTPQTMTPYWSLKPAQTIEAAKFYPSLLVLFFQEINGLLNASKMMYIAILFFLEQIFFDQSGVHANMPTLGVQTLSSLTFLDDMSLWQNGWNRRFYNSGSCISTT